MPPILRRYHPSKAAQYPRRPHCPRRGFLRRDLRIMPDDAGKTNRSLADISGEVLVVSQFTLYADCRHGRRPSFTAAGAPALANELYEYFCELVRADMGAVQTGSFGADMSVSLVNDGPFTIVLDTDEL